MDKVTGTLKWDPELRFTAAGNPLTTMVLTLGNGETAYAQAWGELAETIIENETLYQKWSIVTLNGKWKVTVNERQGTTHNVFVAYGITYQGEEIPELEVQNGDPPSEALSSDGDKGS